MFGVLTSAEVEHLRDQLGSRENRMRYLVQLAKQPMPSLATADLRQRCYEVSGCEARVWLRTQWDNQQLAIEVASESRVVLGLLCLIRQALQGASVQQLADYDVNQHLQQAGLADFISTSRRNGLNAVVAALKQQINS